MYRLYGQQQLLSKTRSDRFDKQKSSRVREAAGMTKDKRAEGQIGHAHLPLRPSSSFGTGQRRSIRHQLQRVKP
jgi:hypothetical protein